MIGFKDHLEDIRAKKHWWTKVDFNYGWKNIMDLVDTHPQELYDWNREKQRLGLNSFHRRPSAPQFAKDVVKEMEEVFVDNAPRKEKYEKGAPQITNIAFCGFGQFSGSYPRHKDSMDVFLVQVINECKITIGYTEEPSNDDEIVIMKPGDAVWIPRGTWHQLEPKVSRVTFSFGFESDPDCDPALWI
jgi:mannose-6-phosphate isomerase-like protein (cupin superfamily)